MLTNKTLDEQIDILKTRGMEVKDIGYAKNKLKHINYYKLKEYSLPFMNNGLYSDITFEELIDIFYLDRALRVNLIHSIEKIEISFKTQIAKILGKYGPTGYLFFNNWVDKEEYCKHYIKDQEKKFKEQIQKNLFDRSNQIIENFKQKNPTDDIPIWMLVETMTLGEAINMFKLMAPSLKEEIAKTYNLPSADFFESWIYKIKLIRNLCAHNMKIYDIKFEQKTKVLREWGSIGIDYNKLSLILIIIQYFTTEINPSYKTRIFGCIKAFLKNYPNRKIYFGLRNDNSLNNLMNYKKIKKVIEQK